LIVSRYEVHANSKYKKMIYGIILAACLLMWAVVAFVFVAVQLYIYPLEFIVTYLGIWVLSIIQIYFLFRSVSHLPEKGML